MMGHVQTISGKSYYTVRFFENSDAPLIATIAWALVDKHSGEVFFQNTATMELSTPQEWKAQRNRRIF